MRVSEMWTKRLSIIKGAGSVIGGRGKVDQRLLWRRD